MNGQKGSALYSGYLKNIQRYYEREPYVRATLQLILSVFAVAFFGFLAIRPTLTTITTLLRKIEEQKEADKRLSTKIVQLAEAQDFLSTQGEQITRLMGTAVPEDPQVKRLAQEIEYSANAAGVLLTSLSFQQTPLAGEVPRAAGRPALGAAGRNEQFVIMSFSGGGGQEAVFSFLDRLEKLDRIVTLTNLTFSKPVSSGEVDLPLVVSGKATAYYVPTQARPVTEATR